MNNDLSYQANIGLVRNVARKAYARTQAMNIGIDYEDLFQELSIVYLKSLEGFDAEKGFAFSTYFTKSAYFWINSFVEKEKKQVIDLGLVSLQAGMDDGLDDHLMGLEDESIGPEEQLEISRGVDMAYEGLSLHAKQIVDLAIKSPDALLREIEAHRKKSTNLAGRTKHLLKTEASLQLFGKMLGLSAHTQRNIRKEIAPLAELIG